MKQMQLGYTDPATVVMKDLISLYDLAMTIGVLVISIVTVGLISLIFHNNHSCREMTDAPRLEMAWTAIPGLILFGLAVPSISLLYVMDEMVDPQFTVKAIGHQWYWSYEMGDFGFEFDSYMKQDKSSLRLLDVDKRLVLPTATCVRMLISSADVIHSWAVPELAVKVDGVPGRLNQIALFIDRPGIYRGMCSELCGVNHAFMPIVVEAVPFAEFLTWAQKGSATA